MQEDESTASPVVTAAQIARLAGVTRAAVANWRRRHDGFPSPVSGTAAGPLFSLAEVETWLSHQRKGREVSPEVALWQALRAAYGDDMAGALADVGAYLTDASPERLQEALRVVLDHLTAERTAPQVFEDLLARFLASAGRSGAQAVTSPRLIRAFVHFASPLPESGGLVYDPACGVGSLLLALAGSTGTTARVVGQEASLELVRLARMRTQLSGQQAVRWEVGDSLREDQDPDLRAHLVACEPPLGQSDWGRDELLLDSRWELGAPPRAEGDLAWLQHCYFHTAPGGHTLIALAPSAAYRRSGRRIRAELVRRGALTSVIALPPGMATSHGLPLLLWELRRPAAPGKEARSVRMVDLTANDPDGPLHPSPDQVAEVALIDLLREEVDLTPSAYVTAKRPDYLTEYSNLRAALEQQLRELATLLPALPAGPGPGALEAMAAAGVGDLVQAGLVRTAEDGEVDSASDQLDTYYLRGFLCSEDNIRRNTSATGTHRGDPRSAMLPQMDIEQQRRYGAAFRDLGEFERRLKELARMGDQAARLAHGGLTNGALAPSTDSTTREGTE